MAAAMPTTGPDTMITVKVHFAGMNRRTKMPLRDMVPSTIEAHIRTFLHIPPNVEISMERYSDSAAAYVQLESDNVSVYKQLYRAAKAKSKLKIRVCVKDSQLKTVPKPVTVEDEPEPSATPSSPEAPAESKAPEEAEDNAEICPLPTPAANAPASAPVLPPIPRVDTSLLRNLAYRPAPMDTAALLAFTGHPADRSVVTDRARFTSLTPAPCPAICPAAGASFAVCCNNCEKTIPDTHYHCSTCDDGDFDLCQSCIDQGVTCHSNDHWLIKRSTVEGRLIQSTTETMAPKPKAPKPEPRPEVKVETTIETKIEPTPRPSLDANRPGQWGSVGFMRTCNCCVQEMSEQEFLHCTSCEDFDLCKLCFVKDSHGHHPKHGFVPAVAGTVMPAHIKNKMTPGRDEVHSAICDGCDKYIIGIRHKCLDCPDWDYCADCARHSNFTHPNHRFIPIYERLGDCQVRAPTTVHAGICCDGPLCKDNKAYPAYIRGIRYKCAVCHDTDFCANCEAHPTNPHNKTHPMIKFRTAVRHVTITTTGQHVGGKEMPVMGDRPRSTSKATETSSTAAETCSINTVQTIVDVKPSAPVSDTVKEKEPVVQTESQEKKPVTTPASTTKSGPSPQAVFIKDTITDGTILPPNHVFEQTWTLRNEGGVAWPAGCSVKFVGGDYMGHVDSNHPAGIAELVSASESTICYAGLTPGQEYSFTVLLRTPARAGRFVSYWRLTGPDGEKFGHRLWCDVNVRMVKPVFSGPVVKGPVMDLITKTKEAKVKKVHEARVNETRAKALEEAKAKEVEEKKTEDDGQTSSQMIFPKLEKESPVASMHEAHPSEKSVSGQSAAGSEANGNEEDEWDLSDDGFMTDEEYDILDASDEEYLEEQKKRAATK